MKAGAVDFLTKPINEQNLLDAVFVALERDRLGMRKRTLSPEHEYVSSRLPHASATCSSG